MRNKFVVIIASIMALALLLFIYGQMKGCRKLTEVTKCTIMSDSGIAIPAKLYSRTVKSTIDGEEKVISELILSFDDKLILDKSNLSGDEKLYKYLVIIPGLKTVGLVNHMTSLKERDGYICQDKDEADGFTSIINNYTFFRNPPIKEASFLNGAVTFNTYGVLKRFGKSMVIKCH